jgi:hypothetical protein
VLFSICSLEFCNFANMYIAWAAPAIAWFPRARNYSCCSLFRMSESIKPGLVWVHMQKKIMLRLKRWWWWYPARVSVPATHQHLGQVFTFPENLSEAAHVAGSKKNWLHMYSALRPGRGEKQKGKTLFKWLWVWTESKIQAYCPVGTKLLVITTGQLSSF